MLIRSVHLENIKSYVDETIELRPGLVAVSGPNGAGKSTILEVIGLALFGYLGSTLTGLLREGAGSGGFEVVFQSRLDERDYAVVRKFRRNRRDNTVVTSVLEIRDAERGGAIAEKKEETENFLRQHLGLEDTNLESELVFANIVGVPQGRLLADFLERPADRKHKFDPLLGTQDYRAAFDRLLEPVNHLQARIGGLREKRAGLEGRVAGRPEVEEDIKKANLARTELKAKDQQLSTAIAKVTKELSALEARERAVERAREATRTAERGLRVAEERREFVGVEERKASAAKTKADAARGEFEEFALAETELGAARTRHEALQTKNIQLSSRRAELSIIDDRMEQSRDRLESLNSVEASLPDLKVQIAAADKLDEEIRALRETLRLAEESASALPGLRTTLTGERDRLARQVAANAEAQAGRDLADRADELQTMAANIEARLGRLEIDEAAAAEISGEIDGLDETLPGESDKLGVLETRGDEEAESIGELTAVTRLAIARGERVVGLLRARLEEVDPARQEQLARELKTAGGELALAREAQKRLLSLETGETQAKAMRAQIATVEKQAEKAEEAERSLPKLRDEERAQARAKHDLGEPDPLARLHVAVASLEARPGLVESLTEDEAAAAGMRKEVEALMTAVEPRAGASGLMTALMEQLDALRPRRDEYVAATALAEGLPGLEKQLIEAVETVATAAQESKQAQEAGARAVAEFDSAALATAREREREMLAEWGGLRSQQDQVTQTLAELEERMAELRGHQDELALAERGLERQGRVHRILSLLRNALRDAGPEVTRTLLSSIAATANEIFSEIMGDYAQALTVDADYGILVEAQGHERVFLQLSGGEQIAAALAVRLAMLRELLQIDMAFLDEPTQNLDQDRRENLAEQIRRIRGFSQIIVVSHDDTFERLLHSVVHVQKVDGVSRVVN